MSCWIDYHAKNELYGLVKYQKIKEEKKITENDIHWKAQEPMPVTYTDISFIIFKT